MVIYGDDSGRCQTRTVLAGCTSGLPRLPDSDAQRGFCCAPTPPAPPRHTTMGAAFDFAPERPEHIQTILDGLDRYNPETTGTFQDYVMAQCESQTYDCYANLALLKLYVAPFPTCAAALVAG